MYPFAAYMSVSLVDECIVLNLSSLSVCLVLSLPAPGLVSEDFQIVAIDRLGC